jgi:acetoin utilization deacetylase AcuC-like enzyme
VKKENPLTTYITHSDCLQHDMGQGHPERADRLRAIDRVLEKEAFMHLVRLNAPEATRDQITRVHPVSYYDWLEANSPLTGRKLIDGDTVMNHGTWSAALRSAGGAILAVDEVLKGHDNTAFVATRPPGHHAERKSAMGFCFFANAVIAARHAQKVYGVERVAIVDFDVHHGNGTQDCVWDDKSIFYASSHEMPLFPGTGASAETGAHNQVVNAPLRAGDDGETVLEAYTSKIIPALKHFSPDLMIISAGFDAHFQDPLGNINLTHHDFGEITKRLLAVTNGRAVSILEGGYDLQGLSLSVEAHMKALQGY